MPITSDDLVNAFTAAGIDTPEKLSPLVVQLSLTGQIRVLDAQISALSAKEEAALAPIENQRIQLNDTRRILIEQLTPKP